MDRIEQVNWIDELAGNIADNLWDGQPGTIQAIHYDIASWGTNSAYMGRGLDPDTGEYDVNECLAHDLVDYALSDEGRESWGIEFPDWFDDHDRHLLTELVAAQL